jgi:hypothetical protein
MRLITVSVSTTGTRVIPLDVHRGDGVAIGIVPVSGSPNPTIQHSFQNSGEAGWTEAGAYWFNHSTLVSVSVTLDGFYAYVPHTLRITTRAPGDCIVYIQQNGLVN